MSREAFADGRYRIERPLAEGGMADVYLARDAGLDRAVAIKVLAERLVGDEGLRTRFTREARMAAGLQHPNIVTVYDTGEHDGRPFIVMELVEGTTLADRLRNEGKLTPDEVVSIGVQACAGLARAHGAGLVHRDIKPANLLLRVDGVVKVADFGIASAAELTSVTEAGTILGTAAYLAPEQAEGQTATPQSDLYSLGAVLYEALTGRQPFQFRSLADLVGAQRRRDVSPPSELAPEVPEALDRIVLHCLASVPADRPGSADEVAAGLERSLGSAGTPTVVSEARTRRMRPASRRRVDPRLLALLAGLAAAGVLAGLALSQDDSGGNREPPAVEPVQQGASPAEEARNLSAWLREHATPAE